MIRILAGNVLVHASAAIAPAIALSVLLRRVGFGEFGQVLACQTLVALFVGVSDLGCSIRGLQRIARRHHSSSLAATARSVRLFLAFRFSSSLLGGVALAAYLLVLKRGDARLLLPTIGLFFAQALTPTWALLALESAAKVALEVIVARGLWLACTVLLAYDGVTYLWLVLVLNVALLAVTARRLDRDLGARLRVTAPLSRRRFARAFRANVGFSLSRLTANVYQAAPLLVLSHAATSVATGVYATIETIHKVFATASHPITDALFGRTSRTGSARTFVQYGIPLLLLIWLAVGVIATQAGLVLSIVGGGKAAGAAPELRLILVATVLSVTSIFVGYPLAGGLGHTAAVNRTTFISPVVLLGALALTWWLSRDVLFAAIVALICAEVVVLALRLAVVRHAIRATRTAALGSETA
jgi:PST family polysaccharide transporter